MDINVILQDLDKTEYNMLYHLEIKKFTDSFKGGISKFQNGLFGIYNKN